MVSRDFFFVTALRCLRQWNGTIWRAREAFRSSDWRTHRYYIHFTEPGYDVVRPVPILYFEVRPSVFVIPSFRIEITGCSNQQTALIHKVSSSSRLQNG